MSLRYVYNAQGQFKENDQVKIDYSKEQDSQLSEVEVKEEKVVETFSSKLEKGWLCKEHNECQSNSCFKKAESAIYGRCR